MQHSYTFEEWITPVAGYVERARERPHEFVGRSIPVPIMDVEMSALLLSKATNYGLPRDWIAKLAKFDAERKQVLRVKSCVEGSDAKQKLHEGDMILAVEGALVSSFRDVKKTIDARFNGRDSCSHSSPNGSTRPLSQEIQLTVFQNRKIKSIGVSIGMVDGLGTDRLVHWAGAQLQDTYRAIRERGYVPKEGGVYISRWHHGSPAHRYGLYALHWILEVNDTPTPNLEAFLKETKGIPHESFVRLKVCQLSDGKQKVITLKTEHRFWPTWELRLDYSSGIWRRKLLSDTE